MSRIINAHRNRRAGRSHNTDGYIDVPTTADQLTNDGHLDDVLQSADDSDLQKMSLPPRYRFRDLLLGDFAFTDDGQRYVTLLFISHTLAYIELNILFSYYSLNKN